MSVDQFFACVCMLVCVLLCTCVHSFTDLVLCLFNKSTKEEGGTPEVIMRKQSSVGMSASQAVRQEGRMGIPR